MPIGQLNTLLYSDLNGKQAHKKFLTCYSQNINFSGGMLPDPPRKRMLCMAMMLSVLHTL